MKIHPTKSLSKMTNFEKKKFAKSIKDAKQKVELHLQQMQTCKQQHKDMPIFAVKKSDLETLFEACEISLDALHGTPIELFPNTEKQ
ncbi:hypothetical protein [Bernardetia sp.]|uniref:hypothetical protein n=1 Tax=Bernardetia sp. TaxID=1937974 RepID=UPI0025BCFEF5|nr:hypothetical protein [Bernardetia sp.]